MVAITSIEIEGFRSFQRLRCDDLAQVNLVVGANNSGKTALLEAIEAVASRDSPFVLYRASVDRNEFSRRVDDKESRREGAQIELDVRHWFHGHRLDDGVAFRLRTTGRLGLELIKAVRRVGHSDPRPPFAGGRLLLGESRPGVPVAELPLTPDGLLGAGAPSTFLTFGQRLSPPVGFVTTDRLTPRALARLWTNVVLTPGEDRTLEALRLIDPSIDRLAISESDSTIARVLQRGAQGPVPLGTLGEGVSRALALALQLALCKGGVLLIDEIENGLHWSVMPRIWRFLVETARTLDVQVFASTHSKDWLEGLADLHRTDPTLTADVAVHRLEAGRETPVRFDAAGIADYVAMELEAR